VIIKINFAKKTNRAMDKEKVKLYALIGIGVLTVVNTVLILTMNTSPKLGAPGKAGEQTAQQTAPVQNNMIADNNVQPVTITNESVNSQPMPNDMPTGPVSSIKFQKYEHDFGTVKALTNNKYKFVFTNTGDVPLTIENATASCGCTVPNWPREPIMPNKTGEIEVEFSPKENQLGNQEKTVTITANTAERQTMLKIKANVIE
jgi:hypothetical protein